MKKQFILILNFILVVSHVALAETTINPDAKYAWGENIGWLNAGDPDSGLFIDSGTIEGYLWAENVGWISMTCINTNSCGDVDYGVVYDELAGHWSGYGWGENIGWVNFSCLTNNNACDPESEWGVTMNPQTGEITGFAWAENVGWLNFDGMKTDPTEPPEPGDIFIDGFES